LLVEGEEKKEFFCPGRTGVFLFSAVFMFLSVFKLAAQVDTKRNKSVGLKLFFES